jgi:hypothetical protein
MVTPEQKKSALLAVAAVAEAIRAAGSIPSGTLYALLMGKMDLAAYRRMIGILKNAGLVAERHNELTWVGPEVLAR